MLEKPVKGIVESYGDLVEPIMLHSSTDWEQILWNQISISRC